MGLFGGKNQKEITIQVEGMHCSHCVAAVERELKQTPGVKKAKVSLEQKSARVVYDETVTDPEKLRAAVAAAGYQAV